MRASVCGCVCQCGDECAASPLCERLIIQQTQEAVASVFTLCYQHCWAFL